MSISEYTVSLQPVFKSLSILCRFPLCENPSPCQQCWTGGLRSTLWFRCSHAFFIWDLTLEFLHANETLIISQVQEIKKAVGVSPSSGCRPQRQRLAREPITIYNPACRWVFAVFFFPVPCSPASVSSLRLQTGWERKRKGEKLIYFPLTHCRNLHHNGFVKLEIKCPNVA